ncbi:unnamed protein product [Eretmochelys imbricata]
MPPGAAGPVILLPGVGRELLAGPPHARSAAPAAPLALPGGRCATGSSEITSIKTRIVILIARKEMYRYLTELECDTSDYSEYFLTLPKPLKSVELHKK